MKGNELLDYMEHVDPELIAEAETFGKPKKRVYWLRWGTIAACFVLVTAVVLNLLSGVGPQLTVFGKQLNDEPIEISESSGYSSRINEAQDVVQLAIPFTLDVGRQTELWVSSGVMQVFDYSVNTLMYEGDRFTTTTKVSVVWIIETADKNARFTMSVGTQYRVIVCRDAERGVWTINKDK